MATETAAQSHSAFLSSLKKYYTFYTGGFIAFVILVGILEQMGVPNKILGYIFLFFTIALYAGILGQLALAYAVRRTAPGIR